MSRRTNYAVIRANVSLPNAALGYFASLTYTQKRFFSPSRWVRFSKSDPFNLLDAENRAIAGHVTSVRYRHVSLPA
jgi:hypothetical protein